MKRLVILLAFPALALVSCSPATAQGAARGGEPAEAEAEAEAADEGGALDRIHIYEVAPQQFEARPGTDTTTAFIDVTGTGEVSGEPDRVRIAFAVETIHETARGASEENARRMNTVIGALRDAGFRELRIETFGYHLQPNYRRPPNDEPRRLEVENYRALNNIRVTAGEVDAAGALVDAAVQAGANRVASLHFEVADPEPLRAEALRLAVEKAEAEARTIADALGVALGPPLEVRGGVERPMGGQEMMIRSADAMAAPTPIEAGAQTITASVNIRYRLDGAPR